MLKNCIVWSSITVLLLLLPRTTLQDEAKTCSNITENERFDCLPGASTSTENACTSRQCCWSPTTKPSIPSCFYSQPYPGYIVTDIVKTVKGIKATLQRQGTSGFPKDIQQLAMDAEYATENILHIKIYDKTGKRFEPPVPKVENIQQSAHGDYNYHVAISNKTAGFQVIRKSTLEVIFNTDVGGFIFSDQFLQISNRLPSKYIYGLGEHNERLLLNTTWKTYTLFNRGELVPTGKPQFNLYGTHPFYLSLEETEKTHGVFLLNSNAMDIVLQPTPAMTYRVIGGILDFYFFMGPTPDDVISQYTSIIGKPTLPPYWSLGFHLCRYEYNSTSKTREVWKRNIDAGIPFDTQWSDIDYMDDHKIFTYDPIKFKDLRAIVDEIHREEMYFVPITDPGLSGSEGPGKYAPYDEAKALDILIKDYKGDVLSAKVWQNVTVFVDFSNPKSTDYWTRQFQAFYDQIPFDGAWIDMNEPYSFESGSLTGCPLNNTLDYPPYVPGKERLFNGTICLSSRQNLSTHYDLHNLYGFMEGIATNKALQVVLQKRPFLLSRSTFAGYGHFGAHWTGDVGSKWSFARESIPNILNMNLFAIPMVGADICGFVGNTTEELCTRWTQLGAFYTFSRNHNDFDTIEQDPVAFGKTMVDRVIKVLKTRYSLLPYLYTLFYHSHISGTPVLRPLFFDHLHDEKTFNIDTQFLWGKALMILPVLEPKTTNVTAYFPAGTWYNFYTGQRNVSSGQTITLNAPIDHINLAVKSGYIIPMQEGNRTTAKSRKNPFQLLVALDAEKWASGDLFWDDGESLDNIKRENYTYVTFLAHRDRLISIPKKSTYKTPMVLSKISIYGINNTPLSVTFNMRDVRYNYNNEFKVLHILLDGRNATLFQVNRFAWTF